MLFLKKNFKDCDMICLSTSFSYLKKIVYDAKQSNMSYGSDNMFIQSGASH